MNDAAANRAAMPVLAAAIDQARAVFGADVRAVRPYVLKEGETWMRIPTQRWPVKAPRAAPFRRAGGR